MEKEFELLKNAFDGDVFTDKCTRTIYATDASIYFDEPLAVVIPKHIEDVKQLINFARRYKIGLTFRAAGTSLAGQATGSGIIVDISKYFRNILELNVAERWVRVQPGVVRDELNLFLKPYGLMFCPETSTSNRCMIGGMIANNSCGEHSLIYGSTRDHLHSVTCILSDGSTVEFGPISREEFVERCSGNTLESKIYRKISEVLSDKNIAKEIQLAYPDPSVKRRNTGYALDLLLDSELFNAESAEKFNLARFICGSEGTLAFVAEAKLNLIPIPQNKSLFICVHFKTLQEALHANIVALKHKPDAIELIDKNIISLTENNLSQQQNRFFIQGHPEAILIIEMPGNDEHEMLQKAEILIAELKQNNLGYHYPIVKGSDMQRVRNLRKAGLGILTTVTTEQKPHSFVEDTAVSPEKLPLFIEEFQALLQNYDVSCAFYGHIATGELHFKPILNLRTQKGVELLREIALQTALLVKKYRGSFSGEHGDGRLRAEFIPLLLGNSIYQKLKEIKETFDPDYIFNPGKIIDAPPINTSLREQRLRDEPIYETFFDFSDTNGFLRAIERCNGSADCRKTHIMGGVMCPSYMATLDENNTTRARANLLREMLAVKNTEKPFGNHALYNILDLCLMCKGCKNECPSGIDMAKYKSEFLQHFYDVHHIPFRSRMVANITKLSMVGALAPLVYNFFAKNTFSSTLLKKIIGFAPQRQIPLLAKHTLRNWARDFLSQTNGNGRKVYFFADEFTNFNDVEPGQKAIELLVRLNYHVVLAPITDSGRTYFSKGLLRKARKIAIKNIQILKSLVSEEYPMVGLEPSAVLSFRDEYPQIVGNIYKSSAQILSKSVLTIEEFITNEFEEGRISRDLFTQDPLHIKLHGHCHQKALSAVLPTKKMLQIPLNYDVEEIPSGCCGMAGSFGYEKEHYELSMKIGELVLFPAVRNSDSDTVICAPGISCRQQIKDGTGKTAKHPVQILYEALK